MKFKNKKLNIKIGGIYRVEFNNENWDSRHHYNGNVCVIKEYNGGRHPNWEENLENALLGKSDFNRQKAYEIVRVGEPQGVRGEWFPEESFKFEVKLPTNS